MYFVADKYISLDLVDKEKQLQNELSAKENKVKEKTETTAQFSEIKM